MVLLIVVMRAQAYFSVRKAERSRVGIEVLERHKAPGLGAIQAKRSELPRQAVVREHSMPAIDSTCARHVTTPTVRPTLTLCLLVAAEALLAIIGHYLGCAGKAMGIVTGSAPELITAGHLASAGM